jgi:hypothetical protein
MPPQHRIVLIHIPVPLKVIFAFLLGHAPSLSPFFAYEFDTGSEDRVPGAQVPESLTATPEPTTWMMMAGSLLRCS